MLGSREYGIVSSLAKLGQAQALHTQTCLSCHSQKAVWPLPELQRAFILRTKPLEEQSFLSTILLQKKTKSAVVSFQMFDSLLLSQTDRGCYLISSHQGRPQKNSSLPVGSNSRAIPRPHYIKRCYLSTETSKSPSNIFLKYVLVCSMARYFQMDGNHWKSLRHLARQII